MAGDWIKMQTDLYRHPRVCLVADYLLRPDSPLSRYVNQNKQCNMSVTRNVMRNAVVGALVAVWGVARRKGYRADDDLCIDGVTESVVDDISEIDGFGEAMAASGWLVETSQGLMFPRFFEKHNVEASEDAREKNRQRQRRFREAKRNGNNGASRNVTVTPKRNAREEKRREEINTPTTDVVGVCPETEKPSAGPPSSAPAVIRFPTDGQVRSWDLTPAKLAEYADTFPALDVPAEVRKALQWLRDNPDRRKTARGMPAFLGRWLGRAQERGGQRTGNGTVATRRKTASELMAMHSAEEDGL